MADLEVRGADQLVRLSERLKSADKTIQREFTSALNRTTKPLKSAAKESARQKLPQRGGLAEKVANSRFSTRRSTRGRTVGIRLTAAGLRGLKSIDDGTVRHPTFGNRSEWVAQSVTPGWFTEPMEKSAPLVRQQIVAAMNDTAKKIEG